MEVTIDFLKSSFDKFNNVYFKGDLITPVFEVSNCRRALGDFRSRGGKYRIRVSDYYVRSKRDIEQTLLHEMIHLYQSQFKCNDRSHGMVFKEKAFVINRKGGWSISRCTSTKGCQVNPKYADRLNKPKTYYMMIYRSANGKFFLFRMSLRNVTMWVNTVAYHRPSVITYGTFTSSDREFDDYPSCRSVARGSYITEEKYNELIKRHGVRMQQKLSCSSHKMAVNY